MVNFLRVFYTATCELEGSTEPTLHRVMPWIARLRSHCVVVDGDSEDISTLKITGLAFLEDKFKPHILHKAAVFFNPRQKCMKVLSVADRAAVLKYVNGELGQLPLRPVIDTEPQDEAHQPPKRQRIDDFDDDVIEQQAVSEIVMYTNTPTPSHTEPLVWWRENSSQYPGLSSISRNDIKLPFLQTLNYVK